MPLADRDEDRVALVLGTSKRTRQGWPNAHFTRRIAAAAALYHAGRVRRLIVSGDAHNSRGSNEPADMRAALRELGVPDAAITEDPAGFRTLDSVVRAREVFGLSAADDRHRRLSRPPRRVPSPVSRRDRRPGICQRAGALAGVAQDAAAGIRRRRAGLSGHLDPAHAAAGARNPGEAPALNKTSAAASLLKPPRRALGSGSEIRERINTSRCNRKTARSAC